MINKLTKVFPSIQVNNTAENKIQRLDPIVAPPSPSADFPPSSSSTFPKLPLQSVSPFPHRHVDEEKDDTTDDEDWIEFTPYEPISSSVTGTSGETSSPPSTYHHSFTTDRSDSDSEEEDSKNSSLTELNKKRGRPKKIERRGRPRKSIDESKDGSSETTPSSDHKRKLSVSPIEPAEKKQKFSHLPLVQQPSYLYSKHIRKQMWDLYPDASNGDITRLCQKAWARLTPEMKQEFISTSKTKDGTP
eukprot:TRINITY_DN12565_c0_g1_i1.p1 TRINITY_DN12565_c0_g1~~TRINITY_DN12565_c0_g1_i1.p1  ORF type:complete len:260 (+),score=40.60 TRINITY_DN12565_c0_g1_i1:45-782(+)